MPTLSVSNVRLAGLGTAVPPVRAVSWDELGIPSHALEPEQERRESPYRRAALPEQCQSDFCVAAAEAVLAALDWAPDTIDLVVMTTLTADYPIPATSIIIQDRLGIPKTAAAFDLPSGSDGFLHALQLVAAMLASGGLRRALLLSGEVSKGPGLTRSAQQYQIVAGHSGSVCALEAASGAPTMIFDSGGDGSRFDRFYMPVGGTRRPPRPEMFATKDGIQEASEICIDFEALGQAARVELPAAIGRVLSRADCTIDEVDCGFFTPFELPVEETIRRSIGLSPDRYVGALEAWGYSSSGSIPLAMLVTAATTLRRVPQKLLLGDTGPGLAWGAALLSTDCLVCIDPIEM